jgi:hypothetical protein
MIGLVICLGDYRLLLIIDHFRGSLIRHLCNSHVGRRRHHRNVAPHPGITLTLIDNGLIGDMKDLASLTGHRVRSGSTVTSSKRLEDKSEKRWDLMCSAALNFICVAGDSVMIRFPIKRCLSVSTTHAIQMRNQ